MTVARGGTKKLLRGVDTLQGLIGDAIGYHYNNRDPNGFEKAQQCLERAHELCIQLRSMYEPLE